MSLEPPPNLTRAAIRTYLTRCSHDHLLVEGTPRNIWDSDNWHLEKPNSGLEEPRQTTAHKIYHVNPDAKFLVIMRDPVERLFSDYRYYTAPEFNTDRGCNAGADEFHQKVVTAIGWWNQCVNIYSERRCAYGYYYPKLEHPPGRLMSWLCNDTNADRLRISLYYFYVKEFLSVFPRNNFLFIKSEDYSKNRVNVLTSEVYPFIGVEELSDTALQRTLTAEANLNKNRGEDFEMHDETRVVLRRFFTPYNQRLVQLLNDSAFSWEREYF